MCASHSGQYQGSLWICEPAGTAGIVPPNSMMEEGLGNPGLICCHWGVASDCTIRFSMMKSLEGRQCILFDSVTKVFHEADVRECSPWPPELGLVGEACHGRPGSPAHPPLSRPRVYVFVCVFTHLSLCSNTLGRGQGTTL